MTVAWLGTEYGITVGRADSAGLIGAFESIVPARRGPPVHVHNNEDEVIHVIAEAYEFWIDGETILKGPGETIFLPRGVPHTFRVASDNPGRNLTFFTPAGLEEFFIEAAARQLGMPSDMADVVELGHRHGIEFRGPANWGD
jgi:uncharacterized cupin superfamily protein